MGAWEVDALGFLALPSVPHLEDLCCRVTLAILVAAKLDAFLFRCSRWLFVSVSRHGLGLGTLACILNFTRTCGLSA